MPSAVLTKFIDSGSSISIFRTGDSALDSFGEYFSPCLTYKTGPIPAPWDPRRGSWIEPQEAKQEWQIEEQQPKVCHNNISIQLRSAAIPPISYRHRMNTQPHLSQSKLVKINLSIYKTVNSPASSSCIDVRQENIFCC